MNDSFQFLSKVFFQVYTKNRKFPKNICHHNAKICQKKTFWSQYVKQQVWSWKYDHRLGTYVEWYPALVFLGFYVCSQSSNHPTGRCRKSGKHPYEDLAKSKSGKPDMKYKS